MVCTHPSVFGSIVAKGKDSLEECENDRWWQMTDVRTSTKSGTVVAAICREVWIVFLFCVVLFTGCGRVRPKQVERLAVEAKDAIARKISSEVDDLRKLGSEDEPFAERYRIAKKWERRVESVVICSRCKGSGRCIPCGGSGIVVVNANPWGGQSLSDCRFCVGLGGSPGVCTACDGSGTRHF